MPTTLTSDEDEALVARVAAGDRSALGELYDRHAPALHAIGRSILTAEDAEDVLHNVFVEVWSTAGSYDAERSQVRTWLSLRMRSRCLDRLRANRRRDARVVATPQLPETAACKPCSPDAARLPDALQRLSHDQRTVIELAYFNGLTFPEISERLHIPLGTVKSRASAATARLRELLLGG